MMSKYLLSNCLVIRENMKRGKYEIFQDKFHNPLVKYYSKKATLNGLEVKKILYFIGSSSKNS